MSYEFLNSVFRQSQSAYPCCGVADRRMCSSFGNQLNCDTFQNSLISKPVASKNPQRLVKVRCGMYNIDKSNCNCLSVDVWVAKQL